MTRNSHFPRPAETDPYVFIQRLVRFAQFHFIWLWKNKLVDLVPQGATKLGMIRFLQQNQNLKQQVARINLWRMAEWQRHARVSYPDWNVKSQLRSFVHAIATECGFPVAWLCACNCNWMWNPNCVILCIYNCNWMWIPSCVVLCM